MFLFKTGAEMELI